MKGIKVTYRTESEKFTDTEYEDQPEREIELTFEQIRPYIERLVPLEAGESIEWAYSYIEPIK